VENTVRTPKISNICFPAGTPIKTDQGLISIEKINPRIHTIENKKIQQVTSTVTEDKYLISFEKDSIENNYPTKRTVMSKGHQIMYNGSLVPAYRFLNHSKRVIKVKYEGDILYNILLDTYSTMRVNNLICETLHPNSEIAQYYMREERKRTYSKPNC
jgi:ribonuclease BN (tRNA processing enzyme)